MKIIYGLLILVFLSACQILPTKSYDAQPIQQKDLISNIPVITEQTVLIDARPPFEFALSHLNGSVNLRWEDFSQRTKPFNGLLELDHFALARRLATYGISPTTPVVVVGRSWRGEGEEGRLAWTLKVLGVQNVGFAGIESFSQARTKNEAPPRKSEAIWKPQTDETLTVERDLFVKKIMKPSVGDTDSVNVSVKVIDVRNEAEYLGKDSSSPFSKSAPDIGAINIPWIQFFDAKGIVNQKLALKLQQIGISKNQTIFVIDNFGIRSAAVTLALRQMGFEKTANFAGGYMELLGRK